MPKKKWQKPKLIVLVRGTPQMSILQACKSDSSCCFRGDSSDSSTVTES